MSFLTDFARRNAFRSRPLFLVDNQWLEYSKVVWDGPQILTMKKRLRSYYPLLEELFQNHLGINDADPAVILPELERFSKRHAGSPLTPEDSDRLMHLLAYASTTVEMIKTNGCSDWTTSVRRLAFIPVRAAHTSKIQLAAPDDTWYLPDPSGYLETVLASLVDFIALHPAHLVLLGSLFQHMDLEKKRVDRCVSEAIVVDGVRLGSVSLRSKRNLSETAFLRTKIQYLQRYAMMSC